MKNTGPAYSEREIRFLYLNYAAKGATWCGRCLNRSPSSVCHKARELDITFGFTQAVYRNEYVFTHEVAEAAGVTHVAVLGAAKLADAVIYAGNSCDHKRGSRGLIKRKWAENYIEICKRYNQAITAKWLPTKQVALEFGITKDCMYGMMMRPTVTFHDQLIACRHVAKPSRSTLWHPEDVLPLANVVREFIAIVNRMVPVTRVFRRCKLPETRRGWWGKRACELSAEHDAPYIVTGITAPVTTAYVITEIADMLSAEIAAADKKKRKS